jgi:hypothetical protein
MPLHDELSFQVEIRATLPLIIRYGTPSPASKLPTSCPFHLTAHVCDMYLNRREDAGGMTLRRLLLLSLPVNTVALSPLGHAEGEL